MTRLLMFLCPLLLVFGILASAGAAVVDFDDVPGTNDPRFISRYYGDFFYWEAGEDPPDYYEWAVVSDTVYQGYGNSYGSPSGQYAAFNEDGDESLSLTSRGFTDFYFVGANFTSWASANNYYSESARTIRIEGWDDGSRVWESEYDLSPNSYDWLAAGSLSSIAVDELRFIAPADGKYWLMDDLTYSTTAPAFIPAPSTILLLGTGLVGLVGFMQKAKSRSIQLSKSLGRVKVSSAFL
ncbi:MAG: PEP-CTERM sorting domain-containing protein [Planctomycetota bacterium]